MQDLGRVSILCPYTAWRQTKEKKKIIEMTGGEISAPELCL